MNEVPTTTHRRKDSEMDQPKDFDVTTYQLPPGYGGATKEAQARKLLENVLEGRVVPANKMEELLRKMRLWSAVQRVRKGVGLVSTRVGKGWYWSLAKLTDAQRAEISGEHSPPSPPSVLLTVTFRKHISAGIYDLTPRTKPKRRRRAG